MSVNLASLSHGRNDSAAKAAVNTAPWRTDDIDGYEQQRRWQAWAFVFCVCWNRLQSTPQPHATTTTTTTNNDDDDSCFKIDASVALANLEQNTHATKLHLHTLVQTRTPNTCTTYLGRGREIFLCGLPVVSSNNRSIDRSNDRLVGWLVVWLVGGWVGWFGRNAHGGDRQSVCFERLLARCCSSCVWPLRKKEEGEEARHQPTHTDTDTDTQNRYMCPQKTHTRLEYNVCTNK